MKLSRLVSIIVILLDKERVSAQHLATTFEVSTRTIYRDIETINMAGIPVVSTSGVSGGFEIMKNYKLDKNVFSINDITAILTGLSSLSNMVSQDELTNATIKMKSLIPQDKLDEIQFKTEQIHIDLSQWTGYRNLQPYLETIKLALSESKLISFVYIDRHGNKTSRKVEPYQIILKGNHWYVQSYCLKRKEFRLFKLSRISEIKLEKTVFTPRSYQKPMLEFSDILETLQINIKLRVHKSVMDRILDFCMYEQCLPEGDEHFIVALPFVENDYYYNFLLSFGDKCECLEPVHVREKIQQKLANLVDLYKN
jgi:predicted DNA-binding transcriptional regulator YafY